MSLRFLLDDKLITLEAADSAMTVLDWLRLRARRTGTKEGCAEGDCGACTVLLGELAGERVLWRAVNACILFLPMLTSRALLTIESLGGTHPVQAELAARHGSQCGFCTPGIVMSLYARSIGGLGAGQSVEDALAGNLCRCTGYGPILASARALASHPRDDTFTLAALRALAAEPGPKEIRHGASHVFLPASVDELARLCLAHPGARLVAGATDIGLWVTKHLRVLEDEVIFLGGLGGLRFIEEMPEALRLGAMVRYAEAQPALARLHPALGQLVRRIGGAQIRNAGTIGGNIANGSPIGDMPPALIALGATLTLRRGEARRILALEDFFIAYGEQDRASGEFIEAVTIPRPGPEDVISISKLSKRFDSDISSVCGAFNLRVEAGRIIRARIAFGGMAATPRRARALEAALNGAPFTEDTLIAAAPRLREDFAPLTDLRGSAVYRTEVAGNLLARLWAQSQNEAADVRELADG